MEGQRLSDEFIRAGKLPQVSWEKIVEHIDHAVRIVGADHVGLGSDFDGAFMPAGMEDASKLPENHGGPACGADTRNRIFGKSWERIRCG